MLISLFHFVCILSFYHLVNERDINSFQLKFTIKCIDDSRWQKTSISTLPREIFFQCYLWPFWILTANLHKIFTLWIYIMIKCKRCLNCGDVEGLATLQIWHHLLLFYKNKKKSASYLKYLEYFVYCKRITALFGPFCGIFWPFLTIHVRNILLKVQIHETFQIQ